MSYLENFHYQILGEKHLPKMVFLHGLLGSGANWRRVTSQFQDQYQILIYDQRGHGRSFQPEEGYRPEDYSQDLHDILEELGWNPIFLVGHSMGGRNALSFASRWPERVKALVIEDIGPESSGEGEDKIKRLLSLVPTPFESKLQAKQFFEEEFPRRLMGQKNAVTLANYFYTNITEKEGGADWRFSLKGVLESLYQGHLKQRWDQVQALSSPTLWIRGENSEELAQEVFQKIPQVNPQIQALEVADSGHWVHFDQPEEFIRILREFFSGC